MIPMALTMQTFKKEIVGQVLSRKKMKLWIPCYLSMSVLVLVITLLNLYHFISAPLLKRTRVRFMHVCDIVMARQTGRDAER